MQNFPNITLALLAGGKATRMGGTNKALLTLNGKTFTDLILSSLGGVFPNAIIIANNPDPYTHLGIPIYSDIFRDKGPLGGMHSALTHSKNQLVFVVSCDMPFVDPNIAIQIAGITHAGESLAYVPTIGGMLEPLFAVYSSKGLSTLTGLLESSSNVPIRTYLNAIPTRFVDLPNSTETRKCFTNINTQSDFSKLLNT